MSEWRWAMETEEDEWRRLKESFVKLLCEFKFRQDTAEMLVDEFMNYSSIGDFVVCEGCGRKEETGDHFVTGDDVTLCFECGEALEGS